MWRRERAEERERPTTESTVALLAAMQDVCSRAFPVAKCEPVEGRERNRVLLIVIVPNQLEKPLHEVLWQFRHRRCETKGGVIG